MQCTQDLPLHNPVFEHCRQLFCFKMHFPLSGVSNCAPGGMLNYRVQLQLHLNRPGQDNQGLQYYQNKSREVYWGVEAKLSRMLALQHLDWTLDLDCAFPVNRIRQKQTPVKVYKHRKDDSQKWDASVLNFKCNCQNLAQHQKASASANA